MQPTTQAGATKGPTVNKEYPMDPKEVRRVINAKLNSVKTATISLLVPGKWIADGAPIPEKYSEEQFMYYHLRRNYFNIKDDIRTLTQRNEKEFIDDKGNVWTELPISQSLFHMPMKEAIKAKLGDGPPYSRKFIRDDNETGVGGEFELIVRQDGKRIDAPTSMEYQESYNFAHTRDSADHTILDVTPHFINKNYIFYRNMGNVQIKDKPSK